MNSRQISKDIEHIFTEAVRLREEAQRIMIYSRNLRQRLILEDAIAKLESGFVPPAKQQSSAVSIAGVNATVKQMEFIGVDREDGTKEQGVVSDRLR